MILVAVKFTEINADSDQMTFKVGTILNKNRKENGLNCGDYYSHPFVLFKMLAFLGTLVPCGHRREFI